MKPWGLPHLRHMWGMISFYNIWCQRLIQKEKVDINGQKGAKISFVVKKIVTQAWSEIMIVKICFLFSHCCVYMMLLIWSKSWNYVYWSLLLLIRIKFGHAQNSVSKIIILMFKTTCINPWVLEGLSIMLNKL